MASRRAQPAAIAAASDGSVLINVLELLPVAVQARIEDAVGARPCFVGIPLSSRDATAVIARIDGAAAEASARLLGERPARSRSGAKAGRKPRR
jgi:hypothetical protein